MLKTIVEFTLKYRIAVLCLTALLVVVGLTALWNLPFDAFPDTTPVMVQVNVAASGWAPEDIERLVTYSVEQSLTGLAGLAEVRSVTKYGLCQVTTIFDDDMDLYLARQQVSERLASIELPRGVDAPELSPVSSGLGEIFHYIVISSSDDNTHARTVQDWSIKPQLLAVPGVAEVNSWGGFAKQYQILFDPSKVAQYGLSIEDVANSLENELGNVPGGQVNRGGEMTIVRGIGIVESIADIRELVITVKDNIPIKVKNIGEVVIGHEIRRGATTFNGKGEAVLGLGFMITGENPAEVTMNLSQRLEDARKGLPENVELVPVYERTDLVEKVLTTVKNNLLYGATLVIVILFVFLGNLRAGLIVAAAIPLSMLFAFDMMSRFGIVGSLMSLGAIDFGLAVDNAVIQVENSIRRLSHSGASTMNRLDIIRDAIFEVRKPTLFGELIIIIVYLPILTLQGIEGKLFIPMALTVVFVLTGSLILSFTVLPALIGTFLTKKIREHEPVFVVWLKKIYKPIIDLTIKYSKVVLIITLLFIIGGIGLYNNLGSEFVPRLSEGTIVINLVRLAGISINQSINYNTRIEKHLLEKFPDEIEYIWTRNGTAELSTDPMGLELSDMFITLHPRNKWTKAATQQELVDVIDKELGNLPGQNLIFTQPIEMRINEMIAGIRSDIGIKLFGDDLKVLEEKAETIAALVESIKGSADVSVEQLTGQPQMHLAVDRQKLSRFGLTSKEVLTAIESVGGITVGDVFEGTQKFELAVRVDTTRFKAVEEIKNITLLSANGSLVNLDRVTTASIEEGPSTITREWSKRRIVIQCNVRGRDLGSFVDELRIKLDNIVLPTGYFLRLGGQFENLERAKLRLAIVVPIALLLIFGLLYWTYKSARDAILIFSGVPLAALGGIVTLALRGMPFSISAGVGFIALSGIAVLNGLVLVSNIKRLRSDGMEITQAVKESAITRLRPVLMTALVAAFGFIPMAISTGVGAEVQRPLATVVVGGILTSTALTLLVLPALYNIFGKRTESEI